MNLLIIAGILLIILSLVHMQRQELKKFRVVQYSIPMCETLKEIKKEKSLEKVCRFVVLADLHNHSYGKENERLLAAIEKAEPDFVVSAGDMLVAKPGRSMKTAINLIQQLSAKYPVYYGNGNHEYRLRIYPKQYGSMYQQYKEVLDSCGVHHLENQKETIKFGNRKINICGLEIDRKYYKRFDKITMGNDYIESEIGKKPNLFTILIAHNPAYFPQYADWGAELTVSGHVHGGIINLPKLGGVISPQIRLFPKYDGGLYRAHGKYMILSRGLGTHTIPFRIRNRAELIVVDLIDQKR
ncbi:MAG: hypothetical protein HFI75_11435 [Lachnospiraceae bacterium]|nr:hypothetical protein [Lachnospiraceae bacterium]